MTPPSVVVVGPGFRFLGGLSVYTCKLANALAQDRQTSVILYDRLLPTRLYPGSSRVGEKLSSLRYDESVTELGTLNWYGGLHTLRSLFALRRKHPDLLVLQWWTAAALHTYVLVAIVAKLSKIRVVIEFHEVMDTGEAAVPGVAAYAKLGMRALLRLAHGGIVHNAHDRELLARQYGSVLDRLQIETAPHGPLDQFGTAASDTAELPSDGATRYLCFGLIRPYKGFEDAVVAFESLGEDQNSSLSVVGETWEGHTVPADAIAASPSRERITFVNRYVSDEEAEAFFASTDAVLLPYRRGSASGPLHIAMSMGLWVVMYAVGGLVEAVKDYPGALLVEPGDVDGFARAMATVAEEPRRRFSDPHSWDALGGALNRLAPAARA